MIDDLEGFFDQRYRFRELGDDFFSVHIPAAVASNEDLYVAKEVEQLGESLVRRVVMCEDVKKDMYEIELGPHEVKPPSILIDPDYVPALITMKWYSEQMLSDKPVQLPYIPVAAPTIPTAAEEGTHVISEMDDFFSSYGGLIFGPHYNFMKNKDSSCYVEADLEEDATRFLVSRMKTGRFTFVFSPKYPFRESVTKLGYNLIWMEFNPYHPLAPKLIEEYHETDDTIYGYYKWGRKIKSFHFDKNSRKYRIHSEQWGQLWDSTYAYMAVFDLVSNFDMVELIPQLKAPLRKLKRYKGTFAPMYSVDNVDEIEYPYSPMMLDRGETNLRIPYYSSYYVTIPDQYDQYYDISQHCILCMSVKNRYAYTIHMKHNNRRIAKIITSKRFQIESGYFVRFSRGSDLEVFARENEDNLNCKRVPKILIEKVYFSNFPRSYEGTLIDPLGITDYSTFVSRTRLGDLSYFDSSPQYDKQLYGEAYIDEIVIADPDPEVGENQSTYSFYDEEEYIEAKSQSTAIEEVYDIVKRNYTKEDCLSWGSESRSNTLQSKKVPPDSLHEYTLSMKGKLRESDVETSERQKQSYRDRSRARLKQSLSLIHI